MPLQPTWILDDGDVKPHPTIRTFVPILLQIKHRRVIEDDLHCAARERDTGTGCLPGPSVLLIILV